MYANCVVTGDVADEIMATNKNENTCEEDEDTDEEDEISDKGCRMSTNYAQMRYLIALCLSCFMLR